MFYSYYTHYSIYINNCKQLFYTNTIKIKSSLISLNNVFDQLNITSLKYSNVLMFM